MRKFIKDSFPIPDSGELLFWTTIAISFVLIEHNGTEPLFVVAFSLLPLLIGIFLYKRNFYFLVVFLLLTGALGRYTRYYRENYASDALLAVKDYLGYFLAGKNIYGNYDMTMTGKAPLLYFPFVIFWYLPARVLSVDLRFFEMLVSCLVTPVYFLIGFVMKKWNMLPFLAILSLTPFLLDLSADGSNDNSAIFVLLFSILALAFAIKERSKKAAAVSAIVLGFSLAFKEYSFFYGIFFLPALFKLKKILPIPPRRYLVLTILSFSIISLPFILASPKGFLNSLTFQDKHGIWGWNIWNALYGYFQFSLKTSYISLIRTIATLVTFISFFAFYHPNSLKKVFTAASTTLLVYLIFSYWTTYAYFTFLIPLFCLIPLFEDF